MVLPVPGEPCVITRPVRRHAARAGDVLQASSLCTALKRLSLASGGGLFEMRRGEGEPTHREDEVRHVAVLCDDLEAAHGIVVAADVLDLARAVLLHLRAAASASGADAWGASIWRDSFTRSTVRDTPPVALHARLNP